MEEFFKKYGVKNKADYDHKVRGDGTFAARIAEDYFDLVTAKPVEESEPEKAPRGKK